MNGEAANHCEQPLCRSLNVLLYMVDRRGVKRGHWAVDCSYWFLVLGFLWAAWDGGCLGLDAGGCDGGWGREVWGSWDRNWVGAGFLAGRGVKGVPECRQDQRWTICLRLDYGRQFVVELRWVVGSEGGERDLIREGAGGTAFFVRGGRGGARRTANCFFPRSHAKGREEHLLSTEEHGGARRTGNGERQFLVGSFEFLVNCGRRTAFCPRRARRGAENGELLFSAKSREGARRTPLSTEGHGERQTAVFGSQF